jgi:hypothetical protein
VLVAFGPKRIGSDTVRSQLFIVNNERLCHIAITEVNDGRASKES